MLAIIMENIGSIKSRVQFFENKASSQFEKKQPTEIEQKIEKTNPQTTITEGGGKLHDGAGASHVKSLIQQFEQMTAEANPTVGKTDQYAKDELFDGMKEKIEATEYQNLAGQELSLSIVPRDTTPPENFLDQYFYLTELGTEKRPYEFVYLLNDITAEEGEASNWDLPTLREPAPSNSHEAQLCLQHLIDGTDTKKFILVDHQAIVEDFEELSEEIQMNHGFIDEEHVQIVDFYLEQFSGNYYEWGVVKDNFKDALESVSEGPLKDLALARLDAKDQEIKMLQGITDESSFEDFADYVTRVASNTDNDHSTVARIKKELKISGVNENVVADMKIYLKTILPSPLSGEKIFPFD